MKHLPIGLQTFSELIERNYIYVDKTEQIYKLITSSEKNYFLSRPRRFGKSLLASMLKEFFLGKKELFTDLWISKSDYTWPKHPVIHLDFSVISRDTPEGTKHSLNLRLEKVASNYNLAPLGGAEPADNIIVLVEKLATLGNVVIIIDEYDKPILDNIHDLEKALPYQTILRDFFTAVKNLDPFLRFVFLTGVSKFSKTSVFSGLNNLCDLSNPSDPVAATLLGYTEAEIIHYFSDHVQRIAEKNKQSHQEIFDTMKKWYNGYQFAINSTKVYNPYSVLNFLRDGLLSNYWYESGTPSFLINIIKKGAFNFKNIDHVNVFATEINSVDIDNMPLTTLLFQTGYLTIVNYNEKNQEILLSYPNTEVRTSFIQQLARAFTAMPTPTITNYAKRLTETVNNGNIEHFLFILQEFFLEIPYTMQLSQKKDFHEQERYYQGALYSICKLLGLDVNAEVATAIGRIDILLTTSTDVYIMELKVNSSGAEALRQIEAKKYFQSYLNSGKTITLVGISFDTQQRTLAPDWIIKKLR